MEQIIANDMEDFKEQFGLINESYKSFFSSIKDKDGSSDALSGFRQEYNKIFNNILKTSLKIKKQEIAANTLSEELAPYTAIKLSGMDSSGGNDKASPLIEIEQLILAKSQELQDRNMKGIELKQTIKTMKINVQKLFDNIKDGGHLSDEQQNSIQGLIDLKAKLSKELDEEMKRIMVLRTASQDCNEAYSSTEEEKKQLEIEILDLKEGDALKIVEIECETKEKENLDQDLKSLRTAVTQKQEETQSRLEVVLRFSDDISLLNMHIKNQTQLIDQLQKEEQAILIKISRLKDDSKDQIHILDRLLKEKSALEADLSSKTSAFNAQRAEIQQFSKLKIEVFGRITLLESQKKHLENDLENLKNSISELTDKVHMQKSSVEELKRRLSNLTKESSIVTNNVQKAMASIVRVVDMVALLSQVHNNLEFDVQRHKKSIKNLSTKLETLIANKNHTIAESIRLQSQAVTSIRQLKEREIQIYDYTKKMILVNRKLAHQQALYEALLNERNIHSKQLLDSQTEVTLIKRKLKTIYYQVANYKDEIRSKVGNSEIQETISKKLHHEISVINKEKEDLKHQNELSVIYIRKQTKEETSLIHFLKTAEREQVKEEHALQLLLSERNNFNLQHVQQNIKLGQVYEALRLGRSNERNFDVVYFKTCSKLQESQKLIFSLKTTRMDLKEYTSDLKSLKHLSSQLENELLTDEIKFRALERERGIPANIHHWRTIESSNPKLYELITLQYSLQKQLIAKNQEAKNREFLIQSQEKLYLQLKSIFSQQVGPEAVEQIKQFKAILNEKIDSLKTLSIELKLARAKTREVEYEIEIHHGHLTDMKKKYIAKKLKESVSNSVN